jgi:hypothetical protein
MTYFTGALPKPSRTSFSLGQAGATKVSTTNLPSGPFEDYHASTGAGEHSDIVSELLRSGRSGVESGAHTREQVGRRGRLLSVAHCGGAEQRRGKEVRQKGAAGQRGRISQHFAA